MTEHPRVIDGFIELYASSIETYGMSQYCSVRGVVR
jgi:hypothetical protein